MARTPPCQGVERMQQVRIPDFHDRAYRARPLAKLLAPDPVCQTAKSLTCVEINALRAPPVHPVDLEQIAHHPHVATCCGRDSQMKQRLAKLVSCFICVDHLARQACSFIGFVHAFPLLIVAGVISVTPASGFSPNLPAPAFLNVAGCAAPHEVRPRLVGVFPLTD